MEPAEAARRKKRAFVADITAKWRNVRHFASESYSPQRLLFVALEHAQEKRNYKVESLTVGWQKKGKGFIRGWRSLV